MEPLIPNKLRRVGIRYGLHIVGVGLHFIGMTLLCLSILSFLTGVVGDVTYHLYPKRPLAWDRIWGLSLIAAVGCYPIGQAFVLISSRRGRRSTLIVSWIASIGVALTIFVFIPRIAMRF